MLKTRVATRLWLIRFTDRTTAYFGRNYLDLLTLVVDEVSSFKIQSSAINASLNLIWQPACKKARYEDRNKNQNIFEKKGFLGKGK